MGVKDVPERLFINFIFIKELKQILFFKSFLLSDYFAVINYSKKRRVENVCQNFLQKQPFHAQL